MLAWLEQSAIEPSESLQLQRLRGHWSTSELDVVADQARELRGWFGQFVRAHRGPALDGSELQELTRLNHLLERQQKYVQIAAPRNGAADLEIPTTWRWQTPQSGDAVITHLTVAEGLGKLLSGVPPRTL